jgi:hypothetical protein
VDKLSQRLSALAELKTPTALAKAMKMIIFLTFG